MKRFFFLLRMFIADELLYLSIGVFPPGKSGSVKYHSARMDLLQAILKFWEENGECEDLIPKPTKVE